MLSHRGILSISWSHADAELLLSSAKDNRILCWNPNTGEVHGINLLKLSDLSVTLAHYWDLMAMLLNSNVSFPLILGDLRASNNEPVVF